MHDTDEVKQDDDEPKPKHSKVHDTDEAKADEAKQDDDEPKSKHSKLHGTDEDALDPVV